jgi:hypothetical protein
LSQQTAERFRFFLFYFNLVFHVVVRLQCFILLVHNACVLKRLKGSVNGGGARAHILKHGLVESVFSTQIDSEEKGKLFLLHSRKASDCFWERCVVVEDFSG